MLKIRHLPKLVCIYRLSNAHSNVYSDAKTASLFDVVSILFPPHLSLADFLLPRVTRWFGGIFKCFGVVFTSERSFATGGLF